MGSLDEVRKQFQSWIQPQIKWMRKIWQVSNSGFDTKISQEHSGFQNTWSGLNDIESDVETLQKINNSGFDTLHSDLLKKQREEISGFQNVWSGLNDVEADVEKLQKINNSGLDMIHTDLLKKQREEISGFQKIWSINYSGLQNVASGVKVHTNPRRYEKDYGFYSSPVIIGSGLTAVYSYGTSPAKTSGTALTIYTIDMQNPTSGVINICLLDKNGNRLTIDFIIPANDALFKDYPAGFNLGNQEVYASGTSSGVRLQIVGTEA